MFINSLIDAGDKGGSIDAGQQLRPDDRAQLSAEVALPDPGVRGGQRRDVIDVPAGERVLPAPWHLLADLPQVLQPLSAERIGARPAAAAARAEMARAPRSRRHRG